MRAEELEQFVERLKNEVMNNFPLKELSDNELREKIENLVEIRLANVYVSIEQRVAIAEQIYSSIRGFGLLDSIMTDDNITEVMINGPKNIFVEEAGKVRKIERTFESERKLRDVIQRIVAQAGREVTEANPIVDTRLPNGSRVNVVLPPISLNGSIVTIRKFSKEPMTMKKLIEYGSLNEGIASLLELLIQARYNIFVCGGTGSGKTTFLNALSNFIPKDERIITIEDSAELQIEGVQNLVSLETRNANSSGAGEVNIRDLIKSSLRMRPDRIIVGEVRGGEALDMLQAMNTGHDGSLSTGHANSTFDMMNRLETMVLQGAEGLPLMAIRQQIGSALDIVIHLSRLRDHSRKTMEITEVLGVNANGEYMLNPIFTFVEGEGTSAEHVVGALKRTKNKFVKTKKFQLAGIKLPALLEVDDETAV
jgi:flp pilus assembly protein, ATPase cpaF